MEAELDLLLGTAINTLLKLEALLYFHDRPGTAQSPTEISARLGRPLPEVRTALDELAELGLLDRFPLGTGKHVVYGTTEDKHVEELLHLLYEHYHRDQASRSLIVRKTLRVPSEGEPHTPHDLHSPDPSVNPDGP